MGVGCKICFSLTTVLGIAMVVIGTTMHLIIFPGIVEEKIDENLVLRNGTDTFDYFEKPTVPVYLSFYFFNVTNMDQVNENGSRAILKEVGPYVYREETERDILEWKYSNATIVYEENRTYFFEPEKSQGSLEDVINHVNVASISFLGSSKIDILSSLFHLDKTELAKNTSGKLVERHTVDELIFKGYNITGNLPPLTPSLTKVVCSFADNCIFGFYYGKNGSKSNSFEVLTGDIPLGSNISLKTAMKHYRELVAYDGKPELSYWSGCSCNALNGTDATQFPPEVDKNKGLYVFSTDVCRSMYFEYEKEVGVNGITTYRYIIPPSVFAAPDVNPENMCFCQKNISLPCMNRDGIMPLGPCHDDNPVMASAPHFYMAAREYQNSFEGFHPDKEKHETYLDIEPMTGTVLSVAKRLQISLKVEPNPHVEWLRSINSTTIFPIFWVQEAGEIDRKNADKFEHDLIVPYRAGKWSIVAIIAVGALLLLIVTIIAGSKIFALRRGKIQCNMRQEIEKNSHWTYSSTADQKSKKSDAYKNAVLKNK